MEWSTACPDWERRIVAGESLVPFKPLFPEEAEAALAVFKALKIVDAPGSPTFGESCRQWVFDIVAALFGSYDAEEGRRLVSELLLLISKKNSKSTLAAGIMMTALIRNWRLSAECLILAPTIEVANNSFFPARDMVRADEELSDLFHVQDHLRTITHRNTNATLKVVAADNETVGGKKSTFVLVDELWQFGKRPNAENMLREATGGLASRPEGFEVYLTTHSDEPPAGIWKKKLAYARAIRDGRIVDKKFLPVLYEFPKAMIESEAHRDIANFRVTNPNWGLSVDEEYLSRKYQEAKEGGEDSVRGFLAKHANVEIGLALGTDNWPGALFWERCATALTLDALLERCEVVDVGIDGGGLDDMLGLSVTGREAGTGKWLTWQHAWIHPIVLERRKGDVQYFRDFQKQGDLTIVEQIGDDIDAVVEIVRRAEKLNLLDKVGVDPVGIASIVDALMDKEQGPGLAQDRIVGIPQGWKLAGAIKTAERRLAEGTLQHPGASLMTWCVGNARVVPSGNSILITKQVSGLAKIDPLMAMFNSVALMAMNPAARSLKYEMFFV